MTHPYSIRTLATRHLGRSIRVYDDIDSTNSQALLLANNPAEHGTVLLAHTQSAGRGQYGRSWLAEPGSSVLMSLLFFPPPTLRRPVILTSWAAVAVSELVHRLTGLTPRIKWPNDVLVVGKKICGILIEQRTTEVPAHPLATVVGIGLNITQSADLFAANGLPDAGSLASVAGVALLAEEVADALIHQLDDDYDRLLSGDTELLESRWKNCLALLGKWVQLERSEPPTQGRLLDASFDGVIVEDREGQIHQLAPETIRHITANG